MPPRTLLEQLANLPDPRINRTKKHRLDDILMIALIGIIGGATTFESIREFARCREAWLRTFLALPNGIPSHDTIYRVLCALDPKVFAASFGRWIAEWSESLGLKHVAIDGKALRGAKGNTFSGCVHLIGAWASEHGLILGQESVPEMGSELAAIPALLRTLHLKGALVTIDAAGCQTEIVQQIREQGGDYLIAVKGNQPKLLAAVEQVFADALADEFAGWTVSQHETTDRQHGRVEERYVTVIADPPGLPDGWRDVAAVVQVNREREVNGENTSTTHYYLTSRRGTAEELGHWVRRHWAIENELHWGLDVVFGEDAHRTQDRNASANLGLIRRTALSLLKQAPGKQSKPTKIIKAAGDLEYLQVILQGNSVL